MSMEYRMWVSVEGLSLNREAEWSAVISHLEHTHPELGPVASWDDAETMVLTYSCDISNKSCAADLAMEATSEALRASGLSQLFPSVFRIDPVGDLVTS